ncbi:MAG: hypothetical protein GW748_02280 [Alphaproteobacteria bacterium]|nr:hypothetical protein [Alphaproteobacteria bacterium]NCQ66555.1 hypothetical protein [Alphaproteobacteria bacterium]NCT06907.1 hypothetical protein [Alphaproteobacteria bacterium]
MKKIISALFTMAFTTTINASNQKPPFIEEELKKTTNDMGFNFSNGGPVEENFLSFIREKDSPERYILTNACAFGRLTWEAYNVTNESPIIGTELSAENLSGIRKWRREGSSKVRKSKERKRMHLIQGDCRTLEEQNIFKEHFEGMKAAAITDFNYIHFFNYYEACKNFLLEFTRLDRGGRLFGIMESADYNIPDEVLFFLSQNNKRGLHNSGYPEKLIDVYQLLIVRKTLTQMYENAGLPFPEYHNPLTENSLTERRINTYINKSLRLSEEHILNIADIIGFNVVEGGIYHLGVNKSGSFYKKERGEYIGFILEKPATYNGELNSHLNPEQLEQKSLELFGDYVNIEETRKSFHSENELLFNDSKYPYLFIK